MLPSEGVSEHARPVRGVRGTSQTENPVATGSEQTLLPCDVSGREPGPKHGGGRVELSEEIDQGPHDEFQWLSGDVFEFAERSDGSINLSREDGILNRPSLLFPTDAGHVDDVLPFDHSILTDQRGKLAEFRIELGEVEPDSPDEE